MIFWVQQKHIFATVVFFFFFIFHICSPQFLLLFYSSQRTTVVRDYSTHSEPHKRAPPLSSPPPSLPSLTISLCLLPTRATQKQVLSRRGWGALLKCREMQVTFIPIQACYQKCGKRAGSPRCPRESPVTDAHTRRILFFFFKIKSGIQYFPVQIKIKLKPQVQDWWRPLKCCLLPRTISVIQRSAKGHLPNQRNSRRGSGPIKGVFEFIGQFVKFSSYCCLRQLFLI